MTSNKKLIKAAQTLQNNCKERADNEFCNECPFLIGVFCALSDNIPSFWGLKSVLKEQKVIKC
jgi:hypothetical protein